MKFQKLLLVVILLRRINQGQHIAQKLTQHIIQEMTQLKEYMIRWTISAMLVSIVL